MRPLTVTLALAVCAATPLRALPDEPRRARALLFDARGAPAGNATFVQGPDGVKINARVRGLPPGAHALHVHAVGRCDAPGFVSAGPHFNPAGKLHGAKNPAGHHAGDLPNVVVDEQGNGVVHALLEGVTLADGPASLQGTSIVVHARADDERTDPAGNAGDRIACGLVGRARQDPPPPVEQAPPPPQAIERAPKRSAPSPTWPGRRAAPRR